MNVVKAAGISFQGDVAIAAIPSLPDGVTPVPAVDKGLVLAYGETSGHAHAFRDTEHVELYAAANDDSRRYLVVKNKPATLFHEEHELIEFDPGIYEVFTQKEYGFDDEYRAVAD